MNTSMACGALVAIVGSTASGKTRMSLDLASALSPSEIVSVDSMQVYTGVDVLSAKVPVAQRRGVRHHVLDCVSVCDTTFSVAQFQPQALQAIAHIREQRTAAAPDGALPVVVGGTHLWLESLLWPQLYAFQHTSTVTTEPEASIRAAHWSTLSDQELHALLLQVDPERGRQLHPHARRKVLRSLEYFHAHGIPHSLHLREQLDASCHLPWQPLCIIWTHCPDDLLFSRIDARVDTMVADGLEAELISIQAAFQSQNAPMDFGKGVLQAIGLKEFQEWFQLRENAAPASQLDIAFSNALDKIKANTKKYAKSQIKWVQHHLMKQLAYSSGQILFLRVDTTLVTNETAWQASVIDPLSKYISEYLHTKSSPSTVLPPAIQRMELPREPASRLPQETLLCDVCNVVLQDKQQMEMHVKGKPHKGRKARLSRQQHRTADTKAATKQVD